ncbi:putative glycosyltransferase EpsE [Pedobacter glucosidilyticus]|nr:glycosyltransferase family 2 protein [Pedobacter glucosidilyticus]KHJ36982.1 putative glycosyltransferase EpsE [Pedobacter glucosidilyticus]
MANNQPLISICLPTFNAKNFICETIDGWLNQSYKKWELIIQDDDSNDGTWEIITEKYKDYSNIIISQNIKNEGIGRNWNIAFEKAAGDFVVIFNADDLVAPDFLEKSLKYFSIYPEIDFVFHPYIKSDELENIETLQKNFRNYVGITQNLININRDKDYRIHWNYCLAKKSSLLKLKNEYGLFYPTQVCDAMLWYEAYSKKLTGYYTGEIAGTYRMHPQNSSKIPLGEFESTLLWMIPKYSELFKKKMNTNFYSKYNFLIKYLYACYMNNILPKRKAIKNLIKYV